MKSITSWIHSHPLAWAIGTGFLVALGWGLVGQSLTTGLVIGIAWAGLTYATERRRRKD